MDLNPRFDKPLYALFIILAFVLGMIVVGYLVLVIPPEKVYKPKGTTADRGTYLLYLPKDTNADQDHTLVYALSPGADAASMISAWAEVADSHQWLIAASTVSRNGIDIDPVLVQIKADLGEILSEYAITPGRVICSGMSGGGMACYALTMAYPERINALVINTGMMAYGGVVSGFPAGKTGVFLASPSDFRYQEMHRDRDYLDSLGWNTTWLEFQGGHIMAPQKSYEQASSWLDENLP